MTESQKSRQRTGALQQVSELGGAVRPVCLGQGGGFSSWAGQVIPQRAQDHCVQSRNWHFLLVHPAQTCLPEPNRWGWLLRETSSELWDGGVGQSAGLLSILLTLGEKCVELECRVHGLKLGTAPRSQPGLSSGEPNSGGLTLCYGCHDSPTKGLIYTDRAFSSQIGGRGTSSPCEDLWEHVDHCVVVFK